MPRFSHYALALVLLTVFAVGCVSVAPKPDISEGQVKKMLDSARFSGAETKSPYEFISAQLFFQQAVREKARGNQVTARKNFHQAYDLARLAYENARKFRKAK